MSSTKKTGEAAKILRAQTQKLLPAPPGLGSLRCKAQTPVRSPGTSRNPEQLKEIPLPVCNLTEIVRRALNTKAAHWKQN